MPFGCHALLEVGHQNELLSLVVTLCGRWPHKKELGLASIKQQGQTSKFWKRQHLKHRGKYTFWWRIKRRENILNPKKTQQGCRKYIFLVHGGGIPGKCKENMAKRRFSLWSIKQEGRTSRCWRGNPFSGIGQIRGGKKGWHSRAWGVYVYWASPTRDWLAFMILDVIKVYTEP